MVIKGVLPDGIIDSLEFGGYKVRIVGSDYWLDFFCLGFSISALEKFMHCARYFLTILPDCAADPFIFWLYSIKNKAVTQRELTALFCAQNRTAKSDFYEIGLHLKHPLNQIVIENEFSIEDILG